MPRHICAPPTSLPPGRRVLLLLLPLLQAVRPIGRQSAMLAHPIACKGKGVHASIDMQGRHRTLCARCCRPCVLGIFDGTGGDALLSRCLWRANIGYTDPGHSTLHK